MTAAAEHPVTLVPGSLVRVRATKWDRLPHWEFDGIWLGTDIHGAWLGFPQGTRYDRPGHGFTAEWASVTLFPPAGWAPSFVVGHPRGLVTYVDLVTVPEWWSNVSGWTVSYVDLDLDVVERTGEAAFIDDEDEFAENAARFAYPPEVVSRVRADAAAVLGAVIGNEPPFDEATRAEWLARMRKLVGGQVHCPPLTRSPTRASLQEEAAYTLDDLFFAGDRGVWRGRWRGTQRGDWAGIAASGKEAEWTAVIIGRFADGRLAEDWVEYDRLGLYRQLGVIPLGG